MHTFEPDSKLLGLVSLAIAFGCESGKTPEPAPRDEPAATASAAQPIVEERRQAAERRQPPASPPSRERKVEAQPVAEVPVSEGDPVAGKFTLEDATRGLAKDGKLVAQLMTDKGKVDCELYSDKAPLTVANFVGLARGLRPWKDQDGKWVKKPLYDGTPFHRIIRGFMVQGGDPMGTGQGGPGYVVPDEIWDNARHDRRGLLCMANRGKNTNGSQFFIMDGAAPHLDGGYTIFGECKPDSVIEAIASTEVRGDRAVDAPKLKKVVVKRVKP